MGDPGKIMAGEMRHKCHGQCKILHAKMHRSSDILGLPHFSFSLRVGLSGKERFVCGLYAKIERKQMHIKTMPFLRSVLNNPII